MKEKVIRYLDFFIKGQWNDDGSRKAMFFGDTKNGPWYQVDPDTSTPEEIEMRRKYLRETFGL